MAKIDPYDADALAEAWRVSGLVGDEYVAAAHDYICHFDGLPMAQHACQSMFVAECKPDRWNIHRLDLARETREDNGAFDDFVSAWSKNRAPN